MLKKEASRFVKDIKEIEKGQADTMTFGKVFPVYTRLNTAAATWPCMAGPSWGTALHA